MTKLLGTSVISGYVPKLIELRHGYIINGQYYYGEEMQVSPFTSVHHTYMTRYAKKKMYLKQDISFNDSYRTPCLGNVETLLFDKFDPEVCYMAMKTTEQYVMDIYKFRESNGSCIIEGAFRHDLANTAYFVDLVDLYQQDETTLVVVTNRYHSNCNLIVHYVNSNNMSLIKESVPITQTYNIGPTKLDTGLYMIDGDTLVFFVKINDSKETTTNVAKKDHCKQNYSIINYNPIVTTSEIEDVYTIYLPESTEVHKISSIGKYVMTHNKTTGTMRVNVREEVTIDMPENETLLWRHLYQNSTCFIYGATKNYFVTFCGIAHDSSSTAPLSINIFEILSDGNLKFLKKKDLSQNFRLSFLIKNNCKSLVVPSYVSEIMTTIAFYEWDDVSEDFILTKSINGSMHTCGYNKNDDFIVLYTDESVNKFNDTSIANFSAVFDEEIYRYQGENIATNLTTNIFNLEGDRLARTVSLELAGAAIFKETNSKTHSFSTSTTVDTIIPITITGPGAINIYPKIQP